MNLSPWAFVTEDEAAQYLKRKGLTPSDYDPDMAEAAVNAAVAWLEGPNGTGRRLAWRVYRDAVDVSSCVATAGSAALTGAGFSALYEGDEVVGTVLRPGTRVESIAGPAALTLDRPAASDGTVTLTFGSECLVASGTGTDSLYSPEFPVTQVIGAWYRDGDGTLVALDTTGAYVRERETGLLTLPNDTWPEGEFNIVLAVAAGYRRPSGTLRGDWRAWGDLARATLRVAQVFMQDWQTGAGRSSNKAVGSLGVAVQDYQMPADIRAIAESYRRLG